MLSLNGINLNLGCGSNKFSNCINVDLEYSHHPDVICNLKNFLPFRSESFDRIFLCHVIEHIEERFHLDILSEIYRLLKPTGYILISYPEFRCCALNYLENKWGKRDYWKMTIFGRQGYATDYHLAAIDTDVFTDLMLEVGFRDINWKPEPDEINSHNTIVTARKGLPQLNYEDVLRQEIFHVDSSYRFN